MIGGGGVPPVCPCAQCSTASNSYGEGVFSSVVNYISCTYPGVAHQVQMATMIGKYQDETDN